jgi:hypothetical protein
MVDRNIEENHELYYYQSEYILALSTEHINSIVWELENNKIVFLQRLQEFKWNKSEIKGLILSLFKGIPIGEIAMWEISKESPILLQPRWTLINKPEGLPDEVKLILDGLQRCVALFLVYSRKKLLIDGKVPGINLCYNLFTDRFMFEEEIEQLDEAWINLKDTYDPNAYGHSTTAKESFETRFKPTLDKVSRENYSKIRFRIDRIFGLLYKQVNYSNYRGTNTNFVSDLIYFRNTWKVR